MLVCEYVTAVVLCVGLRGEAKGAGVDVCLSKTFNLHSQNHPLYLAGLSRVSITRPHLSSHPLGCVAEKVTARCPPPAVPTRGCGGGF